MAEAIVPWESQKKYDITVANVLNEALFDARQSPDSDLWDEISQLFADKYRYDVKWGNGPYVATVLKVLSGPQVNNDASTQGMLSKSMNLEGLFSPEIIERLRASKKPPIRVIAKVHNFDVDIKWPEDEADEARIACHGEYYAMTDDKSFESVVPGSLVQITFANTEKLSTGLDGRPSGVMIGVVTKEVTKELVKKIRPKTSFDFDCQTPRLNMGPSTESGLYVGKTIESVPISSTPIRSIKGKIKTGVYGNGTPQTKAHFVSALKSGKVPTSMPPHNIPGPAPGPNNAFIWVGHLKNNGYLDLLDRPITPGRETIIYASKMLDVSSPIEIKYYFHDDGGFGYSWLRGPNTTVKQAEATAEVPGNDFVEKVAPAIKSLIREKRNFVLVIPEMMYSKGFGTAAAGGLHVEALHRGTLPSAWTGFVDEQTIRTKAHPSEAMPQIKSYLSSLSSKLNENLSEITRLRERQFSTFDGSVTGGNFKFFHSEVIDVLNSYLGITNDQVNYVSVLADGLAAINLASIVSSKTNDTTHQIGQRAFRDVKINRFDFIDTGIDGSSYYNFKHIPPYEFYINYLQYKAPGTVGTKVEMNYISKSNPPPSSGARKFFEYIGHGYEYEQADATPGAKFIHYMPEYPDTTVTLHFNGSPALYAFSMISEYGNGQDVPLKSITSHGFPALSATPNHAEAIASKHESAAAQDYFKEGENLGYKVLNFAKLLLTMTEPGGSSAICKYPQYKAYCSSIGTDILVYANGSLFHRKYMEWLNNIKRFIELNDLQFGLIPFHLDLKNVYTTRSKVQAKLDEIRPLYLEKKNNNSQDFKIWQEIFLSGFMPEMYNGIENFTANVGNIITFGNGPIPAGTTFTGDIAKAARMHAEVEALQKQISALNDKRGRLEITGDPPAPNPDCAQEPKTISEMLSPSSGLTSEDFIAAKPSVVKCGSVKVTVPNNFSDLKKYIPYVPDKGTFIPSKTKIHYTKTINISSKVEGYKSETIKHLTRADNSKGYKTQKSKSRVWSCLNSLIEEGFKYACEKSNYYPFIISSGIRGSYKQRGVVAYRNGLSVHAYGLAIDIDPFLSGHKRAGLWPGIWTGAWTPGIGDVPRLGWGVPKGEVVSAAITSALDTDGATRLGIFNYNAALNKINFGVTLDDAKSYYASAVKGGRSNRFPKKPNFYRTRVRKSGKTVIKTPRSYYDLKKQNPPTSVPIVPANGKSNPTAWVVWFCEYTGMKWGNSYFLRQRWDGTSWKVADFTPSEKAFIDETYNIGDTLRLPNGRIDLVDRVRNISWNSTKNDDPMHFQFYNGDSIIKWKDIK